MRRYGRAAETIPLQDLPLLSGEDEKTDREAKSAETNSDFNNPSF